MAKESDALFMPGPSGTAREYFFKALFTNDQAKDADAMVHYIRPGSCVIDVGSNVGYFSRRFADKNPTGLVVAFEPQSVPRAIGTVVSFFRRRRNIVVLPFALGAAPGLLDLKIPIKDKKGRIGISLAHVGDNDDLGTRFEAVKRELVPCETLDTILARVPTPEISLIKIDVEGGELQVLKGAVETLRRHRPVVVCETGNMTVRFGDTIAGIRSFMAELDYQPWDLLKQVPLGPNDESLDTAFVPK